ncbi:threonine/homoserine efflux transporter RhtA [Celerinatantimonas diazotrophica]|uniref:Threonine/homoserine efflux transporter RhtA n=2 Tax=Celerinatantimonas diazotrophica TaxID=412034 RepID=A0A4R1K468_9GAMM|nr:DMT family transporter [Celerinatantimonas diazotrophica]TCK58710.1 threonine/homoserine efflux transporter RhtA [Celerinatantimonas diazotrophica]CAG9297339.1 hypothetical protein CEDIAZO_02515 [Celerinatantimonas diazotrophica]
MEVSRVQRKSTRLSITEPMLLLVAIFWGTSYGLTKEALLFTSVFLFIAIRFSLTFILMLPILINDFRQGLNRDWRVAVPTGVILSAIFFCEVLGVSQTTASNAAFLISLSVILTALLEVIINKRNVSILLYVLAIASITGVFMLTRNTKEQFSLNTGDYFILIAACLRAIMVTTTKRLVVNREIATTSLTALQSLIVALSSLVITGFYLPLEDIHIPNKVEFWFIIMYLVIFCTLFAFFAQNYAVRRTSPTRVSLLMGSEPLFGALFAVIWLQESLSFIQMLGGVIIVVCVITTSLKVKS